LFQSINTTLTWIYNGLGKTKQLFYWGIYYTVIATLSIVIGLNWGILGVGLTYVLFAYTFLWIPGWSLAFRLINISVYKVLKSISLYLFIALIIFSSFYFFNWYINDWDKFARLGFLVPAYFFFYYLILYFIKDSIFIDLFNYLMSICKK